MRNAKLADSSGVIPPISKYTRLYEFKRCICWHMCQYEVPWLPLEVFYRLLLMVTLGLLSCRECFSDAFESCGIAGF
ncbi:hypothetical protein Syun_014564 [Stephania yunnanensis]|uniref:Uncharacterized protein n=1 Tax=Stephania yunnanensis TaxID=152371 RepID=A0AAP0P9Q9_9MAGN